MALLSYGRFDMPKVRTHNVKTKYLLTRKFASVFAVLLSCSVHNPDRFSMFYGPIEGAVYHEKWDELESEIRANMN